MLILSRKSGETICVEDEIQVTVLETHNNWVKIGIEAPKEVSVHREEVYRRIKDSRNCSEEANRKLQTETPKLLVADG